MELLSVTIAATFLVFLGALWWANGGEIVGREILKWQGLSLFWRGWPLLFVMLLIIGYLLDAAISLQYAVVSLIGSFICTIFLAGALSFLDWMDRQNIHHRDNIESRMPEPIGEQQTVPVFIVAPTSSYPRVEQANRDNEPNPIMYPGENDRKPFQNFPSLVTSLITPRNIFVVVSGIIVIHRIFNHRHKHTSRLSRILRTIVF